MQIQNYEVSLNSFRAYEKRDVFTEELREWGPSTEESNRQIDNRNDKITLSDKARAIFERNISEVPEPVSEEEGLDVLDAKTLTLKKMIEFITGRKIRLAEIFSEPAPTENRNQPPEEPGEEAVEEEVQGWGMSYRSFESHYEYESTSFSAEGFIKTADGKEVSFSLNLAMEREYYSESRLEITAGEPLIDPLVVNYAGNAAELTDMRFEFDLDNDGDEEEIHYLAPGSGFLALDKNEDGTINNGSELFGPSTGDGFEELAAYDSDNNNWIDENDPIYTRLSLWHKSEDSGYLQTIKDAGIGAIYLGNVGTQFDLKGQASELYGRIRNTGIYLSESGNAGNIQQIDFSQ